MSTKVLVVEDDSFTRLSIVASLRLSGFDVKDSATASEGALMSQRWFPHAAVLDLHLGTGPTGVDLAQSLRRNDPKIGIVMLTSFDDPRILNTSIPDPPAGTQYLTKKSITDPSTIQRAIVKAITSHTVKPTRTTPAALSVLTNSQVDVLRLLAEGNSNLFIAQQRGVAEKSVEAVISRIAKSLGIQGDSDSNQRVLLAREYFKASGL